MDAKEGSINLPVDGSIESSSRPSPVFIPAFEMAAWIVPKVVQPSWKASRTSSHFDTSVLRKATLVGHKSAMLRCDQDTGQV